MLNLFVGVGALLAAYRERIGEKAFLGIITALAISVPLSVYSIGSLTTFALDANSLSPSFAMNSMEYQTASVFFGMLSLLLLLRGQSGQRWLIPIYLLFPLLLGPYSPLLILALILLNESIKPNPSMTKTGLVLIGLFSLAMPDLFYPLEGSKVLFQYAGILSFIAIFAWESFGKAQDDNLQLQILESALCSIGIFLLVKTVGREDLIIQLYAGVLIVRLALCVSSKAFAKAALMLSAMSILIFMDNQDLSIVHAAFAAVLVAVLPGAKKLDAKNRKPSKLGFFEYLIPQVGLFCSLLMFASWTAEVAVWLFWLTVTLLVLIEKSIRLLSIELSESRSRFVMLGSMSGILFVGFELYFTWYGNL